MLLKQWSEMPEFMKNDEVYKYYISLKNKKTSLILKRTFDIIASLCLMILLSPVLIIVSIWIKLDSEGPIFYRQERITHYGNTFKIFKFRTMIDNADKLGELVTMRKDIRITKVGSKIRKCRLDETPQLFNVFKGEMSFVGTRPEVKKYVEHYTDEMKATLLLPAGITSFASIKFRDEDKVIEANKIALSIDDIYIQKILPLKMYYNLEYLMKFNMKEDLILCIKTII